MKRTLNLAAALLCVLCALCLAGCKNNAADDTDEETIKGTWGKIVLGNWDGSSDNFDTTSGTQNSTMLTYTVSKNPGTLALKYEKKAGGKWYEDTAASGAIKESLIVISTLYPNNVGLKYFGGQVVIYVDTVLQETDDSTMTKRLLFTTNGDSKYLYFK